MYNALVAQSEERVTVNHKVDRSKLSEGVIFQKCMVSRAVKGAGLKIPWLLSSWVQIPHHANFKYLILYMGYSRLKTKKNKKVV